MAEELRLDAAARAEALDRARAGKDPDSEPSRAWQLCELTRVERNGATCPLPEGGADWLMRCWGPYLLSPAERWAARNHLVRIEQLLAACAAHGWQGEAVIGPLRAELLLPSSPGSDDIRVFWVTVNEDSANSADLSDTDPRSPMIIRGGADVSATRILGELDPADDDAFASLLGDWTLAVPFLH